MTIDWNRDREEFRWLAGLAAITLATIVLAVLVGREAGVDALGLIFHQERLLWTAGPIPVAIAVIATLAGGLLSIKGGLFARLGSFLRAQFASPALVAAALLPILLMQLLIGAFGVLKVSMPAVRPFAWDDRFAAMDRALFFGHQPWEITHALFGSATATRMIDSLYAVWIALLFTTVLFFALIAPRYLRARFFLAFGASWLLIGVIGAYLFASAGPCYTALIGAQSAPDFEPLMRQLHQIDGQGRLIAVSLQKLLWDAHVAHQHTLGMGISAMPSMHNAIALLYLLAVGSMGRGLRAICGIFTVIVFIGSVHLGWHYAVDGLLAFALVAVIWKAAGAFLRRCGYAPPADDAGGTVPLPVPARA